MGYSQVFHTLIINKGKYSFFFHFWRQTYISYFCILVISVLAQCMSVNDASNSSIFYILSFLIVNLAKKLIFNTLLPHFLKKKYLDFQLFQKKIGLCDPGLVTY